MCKVFACMYVYMSCVSIALRGQKRVLNPELELQMVLKHWAGPGNMNRGPLEEHPRCSYPLIRLMFLR